MLWWLLVGCWLASGPAIAACWLLSNVKVKQREVVITEARIIDKARRLIEEREAQLVDGSAAEARAGL